MIRLAGHTVRDETNPDGDIEIIITGLRPGEKLFEELLLSRSQIEDTAHPKIRHVSELADLVPVIDEKLACLRAALDTDDEHWAHELLLEIAGAVQSPAPRVIPLRQRPQSGA
jgi:FlaA1/EpsC-like NDP-sugar epimerase